MPVENLNMPIKDPIKINQQGYKTLTRKISDIHKRMLNTEILESPLTKLEKEALRGSATERAEAKPQKKQKDKPDLLTLVLKSEHKISSNACIIKLPKMPFGKHLDYNHENKFVLKHFLNSSRIINKEQADDLNEITKKFRLQEKQKQSVRRNKTGNAKNRYFKNYDTFNMEHGELKCQKEISVLKGYDNDKEKYKHSLYLPINLNNKPISMKKITKIEQKTSVERLHNSFRQNDSELSVFFKTKYSSLFSRSAARPIALNILNTSQNTLSNTLIL